VGWFGVENLQDYGRKLMSKVSIEFKFLNRLRESGAVNMFGAAPILQNELGYDRKEAKDILMAWMKWVEENPSNRDL